MLVRSRDIAAAGGRACASGTSWFYPKRSAPGCTDAAIAVAVEVNSATVARVRMKYVAAGLDAAVYRKPPARQYRRRLDGELEVIESVSYETVRQALKQTGSSRG